MLCTAIVIINGIGDTLEALPAMRALAAVSQPLKVIVPMQRPFEFILEDLTAEVVPLNARIEHGRWLFDWSRLERELAEVDDVVFMLSWESDELRALCARLRGGHRTIGFFEFMSICPDHRPHPHWMDKYMALADVVAPDASVERWAWAPRAHAAPRIAQLGCVRRPRVALHPETQAERTFSDGEWMGLLGRLQAAMPDAEIGVLGVSMASRLAVAAASPAVFAISDFEQGMHWVAGADLFIGIDSCWLHFADLSRAPTLAIFRTSSPRRAGPRLTPRAQVVTVPPGEALSTIGLEPALQGLLREPTRTANA